MCRLRYASVEERWIKQTYATLQQVLDVKKECVYFLPPVTEDAHVFFPEDSGAY